MIYKVNRKNNIEESHFIKLSFDFNILNEDNVHLKDKKTYNDITIHPSFNGVKYQHGLRIKVVNVPGRGNEKYEYPVDHNTGEVTFKKKYNPNKRVGNTLAKLVAGYAHANLALLKKYNGYIDRNGHVVEGDESVKQDLIDAGEYFNNLSDMKKKIYINKGMIRYAKD